MQVNTKSGRKISDVRLLFHALTYVICKQYPNHVPLTTYYYETSL